MSDEDRDKWNQRYREDSYNKNNPVTLLEEWAARLPPGKALDVACGAGRNALFLARAGYRVDAIDIAVEGLAQAARQAATENLQVNWIEHDLDQPFDFDADYNVILVMWFVDLPLVKKLCECLAPGGYLLCQEHLVSDADVIGPGNPAFRVLPGELRAAVSGLEVLDYAESVESTPEGDRVASARVVARR